MNSDTKNDFTNKRGTSSLGMTDARARSEKLNADVCLTLIDGPIDADKLSAQTLKLGMLESMFDDVIWTANVLAQESFAHALSKAVSGGCDKKLLHVFLRGKSENKSWDAHVNVGGQMSTKSKRMIQVRAIFNDPQHAAWCAKYGGAPIDPALVNDEKGDPCTGISDLTVAQLEGHYSDMFDMAYGIGQWEAIESMKFAPTATRRDDTIKNRFMQLSALQRQTRTKLIRAGGSTTNWVFSCNGCNGSHPNQSEAKWLAILGAFGK